MYYGKWHEKTLHVDATEVSGKSLHTCLNHILVALVSNMTLVTQHPSKSVIQINVCLFVCL